MTPDGMIMPENGNPYDDLAAFELGPYEQGQHLDQHHFDPN